MRYNFENIKKNGLLLYEYVRGSHAYGLNIETSDIDTGGVFVLDKQDFYGLPCFQVDQVSDKKGDTVWYELTKYISLLCKGNPTMLESLFVDDKFIKYIDPLFSQIRNNRELFITQNCFNAFFGYATQQIKKARGLNKKIVNPMERRKNIIEFCYTFKKQGSEPIMDFFERYGLKQQYCGLVHIPNMEGMYGIYYDLGQHIQKENITKENINEYKSFIKGLKYVFGIEEINCIFNMPILNYRGMYDEDSDSTQLRLSSVIKHEKPICTIQFNENGYKQHCVKWREYQEWVKKRNPQRYLENKEKDFDRKNMCHSARLLNMGVEIAKYGEIHVNRENIDKDFLLNIRLGNKTYDEIINYLEEKIEEFNNAIKVCTLPKEPDLIKVNNLLNDIHESIYGSTNQFEDNVLMPNCNNCGDYEYCAFEYNKCTGFIPK